MRNLPADLAAVCRRMRGERRVALAVHDKPDTDAVGAAAGMLDLFAQLGIAAALHIGEGVALPLASELLPAGSVVRGLPDPDTALYALDCGSRARIALPVDGWSGPIVNIDHHRDNARFGELNLVRPEGSSTCELVCDIARALPLAPSPQAAAALYAGISFDTGHFRHPSTSAATFASAEWLRRLGVNITAVYELLYQRRSLASLQLWAHTVNGARRLCGGRVVVAAVTSADLAVTGASQEDTEGIVETLREVAGVEVVALVKEQNDGARVRVSLRSDNLDVGEIAALRGGGGHRLAAGFSSDDSPEEVTAWLSSELVRRLPMESC